MNSNDGDAVTVLDSIARSIDELFASLGGVYMITNNLLRCPSVCLSSRACSSIVQPNANVDKLRVVSAP